MIHGPWVLTDRESLDCSILYWTIKSAWVELRTSFRRFQNKFQKVENLIIFTGKNFRTNLWLGRYRTSFRLFRWWNGINVPSYKIMIHFWNWLGFNLWNINFETGMIGQKRFQIPNITIQILKWRWKYRQCLIWWS